MVINTPDLPTKTVEQYDFSFDNGMFLPIRVDTLAGETIDIGYERIVVHLNAKPSALDPTVTLPPESLTILTSKLVFYQHRTVEISAITPEIDQDWLKALSPKSIVN